MLNKTAIALSAIALVGVSAPALANPFDGEDTSWALDRFQTGLQQRGIEAVDVAGWGELVRADVRQPDGSIQFQYFDPDTFQRVR